jgi:formate dehydrogenase gamma subunit
MNVEERMIRQKETILRHSPLELAEHWLLALSGLLLIFSGFGELPMYKRYMVTQIPGLTWAGDFFIQLKIHYLAGIVFISVMVFHALYHGWLGHQGLIPRRGDVRASCKTILCMLGFGEEPKMDKYLPEQRLAYAYLGGIGLILVLTGIIKVIKNIPGFHLAPGLIASMTLIHTFATVFFLLGVLAHLAALIFKVNRPLVKSIFTGEVDSRYVQDRHSIWYEDIMKNRVRARVEVEDKADEVKKKKGPVEVEVENQEDDRIVAATGGEEKQTGKEENTMLSTIKVKGMSCQHCVMSVTKALGQLEGIKNVQVDLAKGEVRFDNPKEIATNRIEKTISDAGYEVVHA